MRTRVTLCSGFVVLQYLPVKLARASGCKPYCHCIVRGKQTETVVPYNTKRHQQGGDDKPGPIGKWSESMSAWAFQTMKRKQKISKFSWDRTMEWAQKVMIA